MEKYRVHEVAKDFGLPTKTITEILTKYASAPKNHMQVLTDAELSIIFDQLTQANPVSGIQAIYADTYAEQKAEPAPAVEVSTTDADAVADEISKNLENLVGTTEDVAPKAEPKHPVHDTTTSKFANLLFGRNYDLNGK